jgi:hypothetical protein
MAAFAFSAAKFLEISQAQILSYGFQPVRDMSV